MISSKALHVSLTRINNKFIATFEFLEIERDLSTIIMMYLFLVFIVLFTWAISKFNN